MKPMATKHKPKKTKRPIKLLTRLNDKAYLIDAFCNSDKFFYSCLAVISFAGVTMVASLAEVLL